MHPLLTQPRFLWAYLLAWIPLISIQASLLAPGLGAQGALLVASFLAPVGAGLCLSSWYLVRTAPSGWSRGLAVFLPAVLAVSALWTLAGAAILAILRRGWGLTVLHPAQILAQIAGMAILLYGASLLLHALLLFDRKAQEADKIRLELLNLARESELRALRAQINPHFLFNALNAIAAQTTLNPQGARRACTGLADYFRQCLSLGKQEWITLGEELALLQAYLDLEALRFGDRLQVQWEIDPSLKGNRIPPLLLQPLVENAIKHGLGGCLEDWLLTLQIQAFGSEMHILVTNPFDPEAGKPVGTGTGLANVRERMRLAWGNQASLSQKVEADLFQLRLILPASLHEPTNE